MKFVDAYILARTKRKTRRIRMALVVIVSSLLFALLFGVAFMGQGLVNSGNEVRDIGFNSRYLTMVNSFGGNFFNYEKQMKNYETDMLAELRKRGVKVTDQTKQDPSFQAELSKRINEAMAKAQAETTKKTQAKILEKSDPTGLYLFSTFSFSQWAQHQPDPKLDPMILQLEKERRSGVGEGGEFSKDTMVYGSGTLEFYRAPADMFHTQIQQGQTTAWKPGDPYPVFIPYGYLEKLSSRSFAKLSPAERNQGYRELIDEYTGKELQYCYRNSTAQDQLRALVDYNYLAETDKDNKTKPVKLPVCAGLDQKVLKKLGLITDDNPTGEKPLFPLPKIPKPDTRVLKLKIVGFFPSQPDYGSVDIITSVIASLGSLPAGQYPAVFPEEVARQDKLLKSLTAMDGFGYSTIFADFKDRASQKAFVEQGCEGNDCNASGAMYITPFGNISVALEGVFKFLTKFFLIASSIIMIIAGLMIMFTISKVIADSTKEIAVFRSLGARRRDIAQIYYTYGFMLAFSALVTALVLAAGGAYAVSSIYDERFAQGIINATGAYSTDVNVTLLGINRTWMGGIVLALFVSAAVGIAVPVLASVRRKLINILREE